MRKLICDVGINDANYATETTNFVCPFFKRWQVMLERCYSGHVQTRYPTYKDCKVCDEWLTFSTFRAWMVQQDWRGKQLDKDIITPGNKVYSPSTCCFVAQDINSFLISKKKKSGLPLGVTLIKGKHYRAAISNPGRVGKGSVYLGLYPTQQEAHRAWQTAKLDRLRELIKVQEDQRVINGLKIREKILEKDLQTGKETLNL